MKIAIIHPRMAARGGAENLILWFSEELIKLGHEVTVFSRDKGSDFPSSARYVETELDLRAWKWPRVARSLGENLVAHDLIVIHSFPASVYLHLAKKAMWKQNRKFPTAVWYCHEPFRPWYGDDPKEFHRLKRRRLFRLDVSAWNSIRLEKKGVAEVAMVFCNSARIARHTEWVFKRGCEVLYPGLPEKFLTPSLPGFPAKADVNPVRNKFLFIARLHAVKNVLGVIKAFGHFKSLRPVSKLELVIVGEGPEKEAAENLVNSLGLSRSVHLKGFVSNEMMNALYAESFAILNVPFAEPFGLVTLETWARALPLILSRDAGSAEIVQDGENALLVDPQDEESIARILVQLADHPELVEKIGRAGYERLKNKHLISHHVGDFLERTKRILK